MAEGEIRDDWGTATTSHSDVEQVVDIMSGNVDKVLEKTAKTQDSKANDSSAADKKENHPKLLKIVLIVAAAAFILLIILVWITSGSQEAEKDEQMNSAEELTGRHGLFKDGQVQTESNTLNTSLLEDERNFGDMEKGFEEDEGFNTFPTEQVPDDEVTLPIGEINEDETLASVYQVKDIYGDPCILLRVNCSIRFFYTTVYGDAMVRLSYIKATTEDVPINATTNGYCGDYMVISWGIFAFKWSFKQTLHKSRWYVNKIELKYILSDSQDFFPNSSTSGFHKLRTPHNRRFKLFRTPMGKSYVCSIAHVELNGDDMTATLLLENLQLQAFVRYGKFGPEHVCTLFRDETAPLAVGSTFAILTLITVSGFGMHRHLQLKKQLHE